MEKLKGIDSYKIADKINEVVSWINAYEKKCKGIIANLNDNSNDNQIYNKIDKVSKNTSSGSKVVDELEAMIEKLPHHEMEEDKPVPE